MIQSIYFDAYRSITGPAQLDLTDITVLCGPNSAGKSSVIRAIKFFEDLASTEPWRAAKDGGPIRQQESGGCYQDQMRLGIEFKVSDLITSTPRYEAHLNALEATSSTLQEFWNGVVGRSIRIDVVCGGDDKGYSDRLCVALDGEMVLEIDNDPTFFNPHLKPMSGAEIENSIEIAVHGRLRVHRRLMDTLLYQFPDEERDVLSSVFWESMGDWSEIRGLRFNYFMSEPESDISRLVHPDDFDHFLPADLECFSEKVPATYTGQQLGILAAGPYFDWLNGAIGGDLKGSIETVSRSLETESTRLRLFLEGLFIRLDAALTHRHVVGNRSQLSSKTPYHVGASETIVGAHEFAGQDSHVKDYLSWWWTASRVDPDSKQRESRRAKEDDLVEVGYSRLMPSLGRYTLHPMVYQLVGIEGRSQYMKSFDEPLPHELTAGAFVHPFLRSAATGPHLLDFNEVGSGVSFMFPILASLTVGRLSIVEQPELHLHPRAQCELSDVFVHAASIGHHSVIETHSEHLILRLSRRIRETTRGQLLPKGLQLRPENALVYYFEPRPDGRTSIHRIRFDEHGEFLDVWPDGFFAERGGELFS